MGRQAYINRLALGRSAFEPPQETALDSFDEDRERNASAIQQQAIQADSSVFSRHVQQYDERGHPINPASRALVGDLVRAQNDVLATVGVCTRKNQDASSRAKLDTKLEGSITAAIARENNFGGWFIQIGHLLLFQHTCSWPIENMRRQILVFRQGKHVPMSQIWWAADLDNSVLPRAYRGLAYRGLACRSLHGVVFFAGLWLSTALVKSLVRLLLAVNMPGPRKRALGRCLKGLQTATTWALEFLLVPLSSYCILQSLHLLPARPFFPPIQSLIPFSSSSPTQRIPLPSKKSFLSLCIWGVTFITSPPILLVLHHRAKAYLTSIFFSVLKPAILTPKTPDQYSIRAMYGHLGVTDINLRRTLESRMIRRHILGERSPSMAQARDVLLTFLGWGNASVVTLVQTTRRDEQRRLSHAQEPRSASHLTTNDPITSGVLPVNGTPSSDGPVNHESHTSDSAAQPTENRSSANDASLYSPSSSTAGEAIPPTPGNAVHTAIRRTGTSVNLDIHIGEENDSVTRAMQREQSSSGNTKHPDPLPANSLHRVTKLSVAPANILNSYIATYLSTILLLPFEAFMLRKLALGYLSSLEGTSGHAQMHPLMSKIYAPVPDIFSLSGFLGLRSCGTFVSNLVLCSGLHLVSNFVSYGMEWAFIVFAGKKMFRWGHL